MHLDTDGFVVDGWQLIRQPVEETECDECGYPMYLGDRVLYQGEVPYCAAVCAARGKARIEREG